MEEIKFPNIVQTILLDINRYKAPKYKIIADKLRKNLFDTGYKNKERKRHFEAFNYFDDLFKANVFVSYSWQWEWFLDVLIESAVNYSKENLKGDDKAVGLKDRKDEIKDKIESVSKQASSLTILV